MQVLYQRCCGLDIGKKEVVGCLLTPGEGRDGVTKEIRKFGTTTSALLGLRDWLTRLCAASPSVSQLCSSARPRTGLSSLLLPGGV